MAKSKGSATKSTTTTTEETESGGWSIGWVTTAMPTFVMWFFIFLMVCVGVVALLFFGFLVMDRISPLEDPIKKEQKELQVKLDTANQKIAELTAGKAKAEQELLGYKAKDKQFDLWEKLLQERETKAKAALDKAEDAAKTMEKQRKRIAELEEQVKELKGEKK